MSSALDRDDDRPTYERMSDEDRASAREQEFLEASLQAQRRRAAATTPVHRPGICSNCDAPIASGHYCDADCTADHARRLRRAGAR